MNILLSAYACEPNKGSEPGVGWHWAEEIAARGHNVWVVTRKNNSAAIDQSAFDREKINFIYYDLPKFILKRKKLIGVNLYYILWQIGMALFIRKLKDKILFDLVHHITFGVFRNISYLAFVVNAPLVFGPVGGGDTAPLRLRARFGFKNYIRDFVRDIFNFVSYYNPIYRLFLHRTCLILCKTKQTKKLVPKQHHHKVNVELEIGIDKVKSEPIAISVEAPTILYVGRFVYLKGIDYVLESFKLLQNAIPDAKIMLIGSSDEDQKFKQLAEKLNIKNISWINWLTQEELKSYYKNSTLMLFPSLRDSSGNVVLESLSNGTPVVCLNLGGPPEIVGSTMDTIVDVEDKTEQEVIEGLANKMLSIIRDENNLKELKAKSYHRAEELTWVNTVNRIYTAIESQIKPADKKILQ
jgi:glycosyltransferase involved in cell wall biosynthesis